MQLLIDAQAKPGAGKRERGPRNRRQSQYVAIKRGAALDIGDVQSNVVELREDHAVHYTAASSTRCWLSDLPGAASFSTGANSVNSWSIWQKISSSGRFPPDRR